MNKIRTFWHTYSKSLTSPAYYADILKVSLSFSLKFYFVFFFIYATIITLFIAVKLIYPLTGFVNLLPQKVSQIYPQELEISIQNGKVSTNVDEPYYISIDQIEDFINQIEDDVLGASTRTPDYLIVIDTSATVDDFYLYHTYSLLNQSELIFYNDSGNVEIVSLRDVSNIVINQQVVKQLLDSLMPYIRLLLPIAAIMLWLVLILALPIFNLFYLLAFSVITFIIIKIIKLPITYIKGYQLGMHLLVAVTTVFGLLRLINIPINIPFLSSILMGLFMLVVLLKLKEMDLSRHSIPSKDF